MWRSVPGERAASRGIRLLGVAAALCLWGQQGIQYQKPGSVPKSRETWQAPARFRSGAEIQKVKDQCRARLIVAADTLFDSNKSELTTGAERVLSDLGPMIRKEGVHPITVEGHSDSAGPADYNQTLSEQRARTVESWLEARGYVIASVTDVHGFGKAKPVASNDTPEGRQKNRRVEIVINTCKS
jgi:outer membrane protein OmpA-like peptidoglycan-associated protein